MEERVENAAAMKEVFPVRLFSLRLHGGEEVGPVDVLTGMNAIDFTATKVVNDLSYLHCLASMDQPLCDKGLMMLLYGYFEGFIEDVQNVLSGEFTFEWMDPEVKSIVHYDFVKGNGFVACKKDHCDLLNNDLCATFLGHCHCPRSTICSKCFAILPVVIDSCKVSVMEVGDVMKAITFVNENQDSIIKMN